MEKLKKIFDFNYIYIYFAICMSGNMFFVNENNIKYFIVFAIVVIFRYMYLFNLGKLSSKFLKRDIVSINLIIIFILTTMVVSADIDLMSYLHIIARFVVAYVFTRTISFNRFSNIYVNIFVFLSITSLIFWGIYQVYPPIVNNFNMIYDPGFENDFRVYANVMFIYSYIIPFGYGTGGVWVFNRNNGIFWEPGAYQFYLGLALVLLFEKYRETKYTGIIFIIFSITLLSTGSSTGILTLISVWFVYRKRVSKILYKYYKRYNMVFIFLVTILCCLTYKYSDMLLSAFTKLKNELVSGEAIVERTGLYHFFDINNIKELFFGKGIYGFQNLDSNADNTYMYYILTFGIIFAIFILGYFYINYRRNFSCYLGAFVILIIGFSSEVLVMMPIVLSLLFFNSSKDESNVEYIRR